jgi:hypothetical protein
MHHWDSSEQDVPTSQKKIQFTLINPELIVNMLRFLLPLLECLFGGLGIFILEAIVLCNV